MTSNTPLVATSPSQPPVGIDLGTTYSVVAFLDASHRPTTVLNSAGDMLTPSALLIDDENIVIGKEAVKASVVNPSDYAECFKRDMGGIQFRRKLRGIEIPPEVLSALVLERLKSDAERRLGPVHDVVITVPAFFDETRRKATQDAGKLAGLNVLDIINEPTAAAVAFGFQYGFIGPTAEPGRRTRVLVYDLGGGTFDVTILEIEDHKFRAIATDGDVQLGGKDFDERLVNHLADKFSATHGVDPRSDAQDAAQLWIDAQEAKHALTERQRTNIVVTHAGLRMRIEVTRAEFEDLTRELLERTGTTTSLCIGEAKLDWSQIDRVLLVGGSTRMPMVGEMLRHITGKEPDRSFSPDEVVAHGAALYAGMLQAQGGPSPLAQCHLTNVNSHSLGIVGVDPQTRRRTNFILIPKNSRLPCRVSRLFQTANADQRNVKVKIVEGESHRPEECIAIGECIVHNLPPGLPKGTPIHVEYSYAANGRISVSARVTQARQSAHVEIERNRLRELESLAIWRNRLLGLDGSTPQNVSVVNSSSTAQSSQVNRSEELPPVNLRDKASILRRLDALHTRIGKIVLDQSLVSPATRSQQAAQHAANQLRKVEAELARAQTARQNAVGPAESVHARASETQQSATLHQVRTRSNFAMLVLGRELAQCSWQPPQLIAELSEARELQQHLTVLERI